VSATNPRLSILTCVRNARDDFLMTAESLPSELPGWLEWIVVDGASTDGTQVAIEEESRIDRYVSEVDSGVYDAYNKALRMARGRYVWYLNAGDLAHQDTLLGLENRLSAEDREDRLPVMCYAVWMQLRSALWLPRPDRLNEEMSVPTPGMLVPRTSLLAIGGFDLGYRIASDYDAWLRLRKSEGNSFMSLDETLTTYKGDGLSTVHRHLAFFEECVAQIRNDPDRWQHCLFRAMHRAVFELQPAAIPFRRWQVFLKLARRLLY